MEAFKEEAIRGSEKKPKCWLRPEELKQIKEALTKNDYKEKDIDRVCRTQRARVYELKCTCGKSYIGQTGRSIQCRIKEHQRHTRLGNTDKSAIAEHVHANENHKIDYENIRVLTKLQILPKRN
ncbi:hypothetical protein NQ318_005216 [Aromia moschata]|uniref:GIY-YIG domain-containing protein n=1 Tax=Aromia moschata TaxID=1265417 RepID=A0AAV8XIZ5_9CUCU|nr:hypothetical protein NQ318_005216 [Aromia moschata]